MNPEVKRDIETIKLTAHFWNWLPDWNVLENIYAKLPESYVVLTPFVYSYLEELVRSTTSEYGRELTDSEGDPKKRKVGKRLIDLAKQEHVDNSEYLSALGKVERYFDRSGYRDRGDNRNSSVHGYMHPRYWSKESFERLLHDVAYFSKFAGF